MNKIFCILYQGWRIHAKGWDRHRGFYLCYKKHGAHRYRPGDPAAIVGKDLHGWICPCVANGFDELYEFLQVWLCCRKRIRICDHLLRDNHSRQFHRHRFLPTSAWRFHYISRNIRQRERQVFENPRQWNYNCQYKARPKRRYRCSDMEGDVLEICSGRRADGQGIRSIHQIPRYFQRGIFLHLWYCTN